MVIVTRFDTIRNFPRLPAPGDTIHFALDIENINYQCCRYQNFIYTGLRSQSALNIRVGMLNFMEMSIKGHCTEQTADVMCFQWSLPLKKINMYHSAAIRLRGEKT